MTEQNNRPTALPPTIWIGLILAVGTLSLILLLSMGRQGAAQRDVVQPTLPVLGAVIPFQLTNQFGKPVGNEELEGELWLADIIFTRCPGPCARMTRAMAGIQDALGESVAMRFVSLTSDPDYDTPERLRRYGERFDAQFDTWHFLTGPKEEIYRLAAEGLMLVVSEKSPEQRESERDLFIHSTRFILVDRKGRLRGTFDGTEEDVVGKVTQAVRELAGMDQPSMHAE